MFEVWHYYDGYLEGIYEINGQKYFFQRDENTDLYPPNDSPDGRWYWVWELDEWPTYEEAAQLWWTPNYEPFSRISEATLRNLEDDYHGQE